MPTLKLTQPAVEKLKAPPMGRIEYWDNQLPGFGLRISETGRKTWVVMYRVRGKLVRETLGTAAVIPNVADARSRARESLQKAQAGVNPVEERRGSERAAKVAAERTPKSFGAGVDLYLTRYAERNTKPSTYKETKRVLEHDVKLAWDNRSIGEITRRDVIGLLDGIVDRGAAVQANRTFAVLRRFFNWTVEREIIPSSPLSGLRSPTAEAARDRALGDDEIRLFWAGSDKRGWPFGPMFKLLLLTAQRRDEVGMMEWTELDDLATRRWTIPREKAKNDRAHEVHLSELAIEIIHELPKISRTRADGIGSEPSPYLFTTNGERPVSGFSKAKERLDKHMVQLLRAESEEAGKDPAKAEIEGWILHDLRRTAATGMARLNIAPHVVDRILNHVSGTIRGVAAVYNRHAYLEERKVALEAWACYVESLVRSTPANVVRLTSGQR
jgi:integrase